jgi:hypothetical protein
LPRSIIWAITPRVALRVAPQPVPR